MTRWPPTALAILLFLFALALRLPWLLGDPVPLAGDEGTYHALAVRLSEGRGFVRESGEPTAIRTPGLPATLGLVYLAAGPDLTVARVVLAVVTSLTAPALYGLCLALFGSASLALLAGVSWAVLPTSRRLAGALLCEPLAALLLVLAVLLTIRAERRHSSFLAGSAGLVLGFAVLTRVFLLPVLVAPLAWLVARGSRRQAAVLLAATGLILGAWAARNVVRMGAFTLSTQTGVVWQGNNAWARGSWPGDWAPQGAHLLAKYPDLVRMNEVGRSRLFVREAVNEVVSHPGRILWLLPRKLLIFLSPWSYLGFDWLYAGLLPFSLLGTLHLAMRPGYRHTLWLLGVPVLGVLVVCLVVFGDPRFRHPVDPLIIVLASVGLAEAASWLGIRAALATDDVRGDPLQRTA